MGGQLELAPPFSKPKFSVMCVESLGSRGVGINVILNYGAMEGWNQNMSLGRGMEEGIWVVQEGALSLCDMCY